MSLKNCECNDKCIPSNWLELWNVYATPHMKLEFDSLQEKINKIEDLKNEVETKFNLLVEIKKKGYRND